MKRYWLFVYATYYPSGGMNDFEESFDTINECKEYFINYSYAKGDSYNNLEYFLKHSNAQIYDSDKNIIILISIYNGSKYGWHDLINNTYEDLAPYTLPG